MACRSQIVSMLPEMTAQRQAAAWAEFSGGAAQLEPEISPMRKLGVLSATAITPSLRMGLGNGRNELGGQATK